MKITQIHWNIFHCSSNPSHYSDVIMGEIASQITSLTIIYSAVYSDAEQRKHQSSAPLAFVRGIPRWPVNSPHKWPVIRKMFPFDDVIMRVEIGVFRENSGRTLAMMSRSLCQQDIKTRAIRNAEQTGPCFVRGTISICDISPYRHEWEYDICFCVAEKQHYKG